MNHRYHRKENATHTYLHVFFLSLIAISSLTTLLIKWCLTSCLLMPWWTALGSPNMLLLLSIGYLGSLEHDQRLSRITTFQSLSFLALCSTHHYILQTYLSSLHIKNIVQCPGSLYDNINCADIHSNHRVLWTGAIKWRHDAQSSNTSIFSAFSRCFFEPSEICQSYYILAHLSVQILTCPWCSITIHLKLQFHWLLQLSFWTLIFTDIRKTDWQEENMCNIKRIYSHNFTQLTPRVNLISNTVQQ